MAANDIGARLWNLCHVLRDDGITYFHYVTELTYLLFLKMAAETESEKDIPVAYRWATLKGREGTELLDHYQRALLELGQKGRGRIRDIYANAKSEIKHAKNLTTLVRAIDDIDWYDKRQESIGDLYEDLLERNANEKKSGAGQYFTPRPLIDAMVECIKPKAGEIVQDPAAGTGGFLIAADRRVKAETKDLSKLSAREQKFQIEEAFQGVELVQDTHRLALMNLSLHDMHGPLHLADTLSTVGKELPPADVILTNPPFGTKKAAVCRRATT